MKCYRQINLKDRKKIAKLKSYRLSVSEIARRTGFNKSTISRELRRHSIIQENDHMDLAQIMAFCGHEEAKKMLEVTPTLIKSYWSYSAKSAQYGASETRLKSVRKKKFSSEIDDWIRQKLNADWTPEHIAGRSKIECANKFSHEYVYQLVIRDRKAGGKLYRKLKRFGKRKKRVGERDYKHLTIPDRVSISKRPKIVSKRKRIGDLEGDLIVGYKQSGYILTIVDRKSRFLAMEFIKKRDKVTVLNAFLKALKRMPKPKTLTLDNAREFSCHIDLTKQTGIDVYFADPYSSFQRGSIENINGWIRYYFPKRKTFSNLNSESLSEVERKLNTRPRKVLGYLTPEEVAFRS